MKTTEDKMKWTKEMIAAIPAAKENLAQWYYLNTSADEGKKIIASVLNKVGCTNLIFLRPDGEWNVPSYPPSQSKKEVYRLKPDFQPPAEVTGEWIEVEVRPLENISNYVHSKNRYGFKLDNAEYMLSCLSDFRNGGVRWRFNNGTESWNALDSWLSAAGKNQEPPVPVAVRIWVEK